jgi:hypothetical protein
VKTQFGQWRFFPSNNTLRLIQNGRERYEIDLDRITNAAELLDWILHIESKPWASYEVMQDLTIALPKVLPLRIKRHIKSFQYPTG